MALLHQATLIPSKRDILSTWLPTQPWYDGTGEVSRVDAYRFDDPAGEVGLEAALVGTGGGVVLHVPFSYRAEPLAGADEHLVATAEHSVLGTRYFYDACGDPVWVTALVTAIVAGGTEAEQFVEADGGPVRREVTMRVRGSGSAASAVAPQVVRHCEHRGDVTVVTTEDVEVVVARRVGAEVDGSDVDGSEVLTGTWDGGRGSAVLAGVRRRG